MPRAKRNKQVDRPRVADAMVMINGEPRECLRDMLDCGDCVLRKAYAAETGKPSKWWVLVSARRVVSVLVDAKTVERWKIEFFVAPVDVHSPEWLWVRRCERCGCVGYYIHGDGRCEECVGIED